MMKHEYLKSSGLALIVYNLNDKRLWIITAKCYDAQYIKNK